MIDKMTMIEYCHQCPDRTEGQNEDSLKFICALSKSKKEKNYFKKPPNGCPLIKMKKEK